MADIPNRQNFNIAGLNVPAYQGNYPGTYKSLGNDSVISTDFPINSADQTTNIPGRVVTLNPSKQAWETGKPNTTNRLFGILPGFSFGAVNPYTSNLYNQNSNIYPNTGTDPLSIANPGVIINAALVVVEALAASPAIEILLVL